MQSNFPLFSNLWGKLAFVTYHPVFLKERQILLLIIRISHKLMKFSAATFRQAYVESFTTIYLLFTVIVYFSVNFLPSLKSQTDSVLSFEVDFFLNLFF